MRRLELDIFYVSSRAAILLLFSLHISDVSSYRDYADRWFRDGLLPYQGFPYEYPPLSIPFVFFPALIAKVLGWTSLASFHAIFAALLFPLDWLLYRRFKKSPPIPGAAFFYTLLTVWMGQLLFDRFDLAVAFLIAWPFVAGATAAESFAFFWGLGGGLKLVPLMLAPLLAPGRRWLELARAALIAGLPLAAGIALAAWLGKGSVSFLSHHAHRGVQIESLAGSLLLAFQAITGKTLWQIDTNFGAQHLAGSVDLARYARAFFWGAMVATFSALWLHRRELALVARAWILLLTFLTCGYVLSPQFLIWLIPLGICAAAEVPAGRARKIWLTLFTASVVATGIHFASYFSYVDQKPAAITLLVARNLLLVALLVLSWMAMSRAEKTDSILIDRDSDHS